MSNYCVYLLAGSKLRGEQRIAKNGLKHNNIIILILHMRKLGFREDEQFGKSLKIYSMW